MLEPNQFNVNDAWLVFQLNDTPINTARDGSFNAVCLMDAASCFILATGMVPIEYEEPSELEVRRLFKAAWEQSHQLPAKLFIPAGQFETSLAAHAERQGVSVVTVAESELTVFTEEAKQGFKEHVLEGRKP